MIRYHTREKGSEFYKETRKLIEYYIEPYLTEMQCENCDDDTYIYFYNIGGHATSKIVACCDEFKRRINEKLLKKE